MTLEAKQEHLRSFLRTRDGLLVAYSGGVDSGYLAFEASRCLGGRMLAVLADSASMARSQLLDATAFAEETGIPLRVIQTSEMSRPEYVRNDSRRCFHCKDELFSAMTKLKRELGFAHIAYGKNVDDQSDFRPGGEAAERHGVTAPLVEAGLGKDEIRQLAKAAGLRIWDKPASACMASRIEPGRPVTQESLRMVEAGEEAMAALGVHQCRVRHHGDLARIEIARSELEKVLSLQLFDLMTERLKAVGYRYVTLDTEGYRSGSMNGATFVFPATSLRGAQ